MFSEELKARRKELGLSQKDLAERALIGDVQISTYERGKVIPNEKSMKKLALALKLDENYFLKFINKEQNKGQDYITLITAELVSFFKDQPSESTSKALLEIIKIIKSLKVTQSSN